MVVDDVFSTIGTTNLDFRSMETNFEVNAFIYENKTAIQLRQLFLLDVVNCEEVFLEAWTNRRRRQKLKESMARLFSPLM